MLHFLHVLVQAHFFSLVSLSLREPWLGQLQAQHLNCGLGYYWYYYVPTSFAR